MCVGERFAENHVTTSDRRPGHLEFIMLSPTLQGNRQAAGSTATLRISGGDASSLIARLLSDNIGRVFLVTGVAVQIATRPAQQWLTAFSTVTISVATTVGI